jgi:hypothetical protein
LKRIGLKAKEFLLFSFLKISITITSHLSFCILFKIIFITTFFFSFKLDEDLKNEILNRINHEYPKNDKERNENILKSIQSILDPKYSHLINICRPINGNAEVDVAILKAFLKSKKQEYQTQLKFAQSWNRIDIARDFIFTDENKDNVSLPF